MTTQAETVRIVVAAERVDWLPILKRAALVALVTFLLTIGIVGFETISSTGQLALQTRFGPVAFAVIAAFIGYIVVALLQLRRPMIPLILGVAAFLLLALALLAEGPYSPLRFLLPFEAIILDWAALAFPLIIVLRAVQIAMGARARATGAAVPL